MKIRELLCDESKWTKGEFARISKGGDRCAPTSPNATCFCLSGAIIRCYDGPQEQQSIQYIRIREHISKWFGYDSVAGWNDLPSTTFTDIRKIIEELDV